ncbi:uncharacterized protein LOC133180242 [Saccostrea echinata]|uniref:uncharacterized protein LOC133180242 n=1 Tax=Saccostrea echinata TaxID=191078 RepID=UPI002A8120DD|nr:uncharacterized protein LOC133180242 [Saccostrea echinata]
MNVLRINIIFFVILMNPGILLDVINEDQIENGFCHNDTKRLQVYLDCDLNSTSVTVEGDSNYIAHCIKSQNGNVSCAESGLYNETYGFLEFTFTFNHSKHAGKSMWINSTCVNGTDHNKNITLFPCLSGFTAIATYNKTHVFIVCKHIFFNMSKEISIIDTSSDDRIETCRWNVNTSTTQCFVQNHGHPSGIDGFISNCKQGQVFLCSMDGQNVKITPEKVVTSGQKSAKTQAMNVHSTYQYIFILCLFMF